MKGIFNKTLSVALLMSVVSGVYAGGDVAVAAAAPAATETKAPATSTLKTFAKAAGVVGAGAAIEEAAVRGFNLYRGNDNGQYAVTRGLSYVPSLVKAGWNGCTLKNGKVCVDCVKSAAKAVLPSVVYNNKLATVLVVGVPVVGYNVYKHFTKKPVVKVAPVLPLNAPVAPALDASELVLNVVTPGAAVAPVVETIPVAPAVETTPVVEAPVAAQIVGQVRQDALAAVALAAAQAAQAEQARQAAAQAARAEQARQVAQAAQAEQARQDAIVAAALVAEQAQIRTAAVEMLKTAVNQLPGNGRVVRFANGLTFDLALAAVCQEQHLLDVTDVTTLGKAIEAFNSSVRTADKTPHARTIRDLLNKAIANA